ncbi:hypothetical protein FDZ71_02040, partial [bacterium]
MAFAIVKTYKTTMEAECDRAALEGSGIPATILDGELARIRFTAVFYTGGIKLAVPEELLGEALKILDLGENQTKAWSGFCPKCQIPDTVATVPGLFFCIIG